MNKVIILPETIEIPFSELENGQLFTLHHSAPDQINEVYMKTSMREDDGQAWYARLCDGFSHFFSDRTLVHPVTQVSIFKK